MKLFYYNGNNFGDQLNPYIFNRLLPGFFNEDEGEVFLGIGSILGFDEYKSAKIKIIFSSGIATGNKKEYGTPPRIDDSYKFLCVRGPLTAKLLNIDPKLAITDGAALLRALDIPSYSKQYGFSFIPHKNTVYKYDWEPLCEKMGINFINPQDEPESVIRGILQSNVIMAESLHAAIVADALRIPWIPFKTFYSINAFKWKDWTMSLGLPYHPYKLLSLFQEDRLSHLLEKIIRHQGLNKVMAKSYVKIQDNFILPKIMEQLDKLKSHTRFLSDDAIISDKTEALMDKIILLKTRKKHSFLT
jgi:succinoglycan biosynthesis protein ExoV